MDKTIIEGINKQEVEEKIKKIFHLEKDEAVRITVVKEPKKILFLNIKGKYEVEIVSKAELEAEKIEAKKQEVKKQETKKQEIKKQEIKPIVKREPQIVANNDTNVDKIRSFMKEFIVNSKLDIKIKDIKKDENRYIVNLEGRDVRYLIGEKGSTLKSFEYLLSMAKTLRDVKVVLDSNNYKDKREESLRELAKRKGEKVLETGKSIKLNPMSARERKIIHEEISFMNELETESVGEEPKRCLVIKKKR
ncbi:MAG: R3H domain-containing nucleic acid-binding protein [Leptotrichiaceae bacterium]